MLKKLKEAEIIYKHKEMIKMLGKKRVLDGDVHWYVEERTRFLTTQISYFFALTRFLKRSTRPVVSNTLS